MSFKTSQAGPRPFSPSQNVQNGSSYASTSRGKTTTSRPVPLDLPALQGSSRLVQEQLLKDAQIIPDLSDMLTIRMSPVVLASTTTHTFF